MRRWRKPDTEAPGQDAFLDIVANLVGILIILIIVVGVRAKDALVDASPKTDTGRPLTEVTESKSRLAAAEAAVSDFEERLQREQFEVAFRRKERDTILTYITAAEHELGERRLALEASQRKQFDIQNQLASERQELDELQQLRDTIENSAAPKAIIQHLPTPMAKTVFGRELHFRLANGRLAYVPWDELVKELKDEAPQKIWKLKNASRITETAGPRHGFRMKYTLRKGRYSVSTPAGPAMGQKIELERFILVPLREPMGEPIRAALQSDSEFTSILQAQDPERTTITVWVYADSFGDFRRVRAFLYRRGFLTASRPLPDGHPIGGSPRGSRSAAQ